MDSRALDINAAWLGVPTETLMENAGRAVAEACRGYGKIAVFCGRGNNGGDGLVAARHLIQGGAEVTVFYLEGERSELNRNNLEKIPNNLKKIVNNSDDFNLSGYDLVIDALVGVGLEGKLRQPLKAIIQKINGFDAKKISVDAPSANMVEADEVVSFHQAKVPGAKVVDIGIPKEAQVYVGPGDVVTALPERRKTSHKGEHGRVVVFGGSRQYIGAPVLVAQAALKAGADLVTVCVPQYVADKMPYDPNLIVYPLKSADYLMEEDVEEVLDMKYDAMVFGNGVGRKSKEAVDKLMQEINKPVVLDGDALSIGERGYLNENMILTPHSMEYRRLFGELDDRKADVEESARESGTVIVLKGEVDVISDGIETRLNKTGNPYMTVGGTGDVLAGIAGGLVAQNSDLMKSACAAAFITGFAGDLAADDLGVSLTATDLIVKVPDVIRACRNIG